MTISDDFIDVKGYKGYYKLNKKGEVLSVPRNGTRKTPRILKQRISSKGYPAVCLSKKGKSKWWTIHRLLAIHFIPNPKRKSDVNHINGNKLDYSLENLEWATRRENFNHALKTGLWKSKGGNRGVKHRAAQVTEDDVKIIRSQIQEGQRVVDIAKFHNVTPNLISQIKGNRSWKHI